MKFFLLGRSISLRSLKVSALGLLVCALILPFALSGCSLLIPSVTPTVATEGQEVTVPLDVVQNPSGGVLALVPIYINDQGPFRFALDTGASNSLIDLSLVQQLGLPIVGRAGPVTGVTGSQNASIVRVDRWRVGDQALPATTAITLALPAANSGPGLRGLLGSDILSTFGAVGVDYTRQVLILREKD